LTKANHNASPSGKSASNSKRNHASLKVPTLEAEMIQLRDDFAEFSDISAFLNHAMANTLSGQEVLNPEIIAGARICSHCLQSRTSQLKQDIQRIHARYAKEHKEKIK